MKMFNLCVLSAIGGVIFGVSHFVENAGIIVLCHLILVAATFVAGAYARKICYEERNPPLAAFSLSAEEDGQFYCFPLEEIASCRVFTKGEQKGIHVILKNGNRQSILFPNDNKLRDTYFNFRRIHQEYADYKNRKDI